MDVLLLVTSCCELQCRCSETIRKYFTGPANTQHRGNTTQSAFATSFWSTAFTHARPPSRPTAAAAAYTKKCHSQNKKHATLRSLHCPSMTFVAQAPHCLWVCYQFLQHRQRIGLDYMGDHSLRGDASFSKTQCFQFNTVLNHRN